jgi:hypothetical protein
VVRGLVERMMAQPATTDEPWVVRLRQTVEAADLGAEIDETDEEVAELLHSRAPAPTSITIAPPDLSGFDEIKGQATVVATLKARVLTGLHETSIVLHGPNGVGKRTLARLYAKAAMCERSTSEAAPCGVCDSCRAFGQGSAWDYVELDLSSDRDEDRARELAAMVAFPPRHALRRVAVLDRVDETVPDVFDVLLKTIEVPPERSRTTFVLLAQDARRVRLAGLSRCYVFRLVPLQPTTMRTVIRARSDAAGVDLNPMTMDVLVAASGGLLGRLDEVWGATVERGVTTLAGVRTALGLDWGRETIDAWQSMLIDALPNAPLGAETDDVSLEERIMRWQTFLHNLDARLAGNVPSPDCAVDAAFVHLDEGSLQMIADTLKALAAAQGMVA